MKFWILSTDFEDYSNIKFHENPSSGSPVVPYIRTDGSTFFSPLLVQRYLSEDIQQLCLTVTINGKQEIPPVIYLLFLSSNTSDWWLVPHRRGFYITHSDAPQSDEWSMCRRDLYLKTNNTYNRQTSMHPVGFEPTISAGERPQNYALDLAANGTGKVRHDEANIRSPEFCEYD